MRPICSMCQRELPESGRGYIVGRPKSFLVCRDCWKGWVCRNAPFLSRVICGAVSLRSLPNG